jgi:hypothetical protein
VRKVFKLVIFCTASVKIPSEKSLPIHLKVKYILRIWPIPNILLLKLHLEIQLTLINNIINIIMIIPYMPMCSLNKLLPSLFSHSVPSFVKQCLLDSFCPDSVFNSPSYSPLSNLLFSPKHSHLSTTGSPPFTFMSHYHHNHKDIRFMFHKWVRSWAWLILLNIVLSSPIYIYI